MVSNKFNYSDDMVQDNSLQGKDEDKAILRHQRLEQRNDALANEFRNLKPEISNAYNTLCNLVEKSDELSDKTLTLLTLLKTALPLRLTDKDRKALQNELHGIADNAVVKIHKERERTEKEIRMNNSRISIPQTTFWCMIALLLLLAMFFALVLFANVKLLHSGALTEIIIICAILIAITLTVTALIFYRQKH